MTSASLSMAPSVSPEAFKDGMARLAGAVTIVTTDGPGGRAGFTATAVCSVTADPPTILACLNAASSATPSFAANAACAVNVTTAQQAAVALAFGGRTPMEDRFADGWDRGDSGAPVLRDSLAVFEGEIVARTKVGSHWVLFIRVTGVTAGDGAASVYWNRGFHTLG